LQTVSQIKLRRHKMGMMKTEPVPVI